MRNTAWIWVGPVTSIALAAVLGACTEETGTGMNPIMAAGASGAPIAGAAGFAAGAGAAGLTGGSGSGGIGAAGMIAAGAGGAPVAGMQGGGGAGGASGTGAAGMSSAGGGGMAAGTGGASGAGTGGMTAGMGGMSGGGAGAGSGGQGGSGGSGTTFAAVYTIISAKCGGAAGCHINGTSGGLAMPNAATAYDNLVGVNSQECSGEVRVVAGDADASVIVQAVEGEACVERMPRGRAALTANEITTIRTWIDGGAAE